MAKTKTKTTRKNKKRVTKKTEEFSFFTKVMNGAKKLLSSV